MDKNDVGIFSVLGQIVYTNCHTLTKACLMLGPLDQANRHILTDPGSIKSLFVSQPTEPWGKLVP